MLSEPQYQVVGNNQVTIDATFVVIPGLPLFQYPSNWGVDSIFLEERDGFGQDLVKLTGTWDRGDRNYVLWSEQFDNAAWLKFNCTVVANSVADPNGNLTADAVTFSVTGASAQLDQFPLAIGAAVAGQRATFSIWMKAASGTPSLNLQLNGALTGLISAQTFVLSTVWQRVSVSGIVPNTETGLQFIMLSPTSTTIAYHLWGAQAELGGTGAPSTYTQTTAASVVLSAPQSNANYHGGFSYFNAGTDITNKAEWLYFGYGFRVWAPKGPQMGFLPVVLDGVVQNTIDLYSAAPIPSATVFTVQNVSLGLHRVSVQAINLKNAASSGFIVAADAIEVMR
jgi:hypothetical protein